MRRGFRVIWAVFLTSLLLHVSTVSHAGSTVIYREGTTSIELRDASGLKGLETPFNHPYIISEAKLRNILFSLHYREKGLLKRGASKKVLNQEEIDKILIPMVEALSKARPEEDLLVSLRSSGGLLHDFSSSFTCFVTGGHLNIAFRQLKAKSGDTPTSKEWKVQAPPEPTSISHSGFWELVSGEGHVLKEGHTNWVVIDMENEAFKKEPTSLVRQRRDKLYGPLEERLRKIEEAVGLTSSDEEQNAPTRDSPGGGIEQAPPQEKDLGQKFKDLKKMLDEELISPEDYAHKKAELLKEESSSDKGIPDRLKELRNLKDEGLITEKDYEKKKEELLDRL